MAHHRILLLWLWHHQVENKGADDLPTSDYVAEIEVQRAKYADYG